MKSMIKNGLIRILGEDRAHVLIRRLRGREVFSEADVIRRYFRQHPRKGVMIDVGAHFGESFFPYARLGWRVYAFEPDPVNRAKIEAAASLESCRLFACAISDHEADAVPFYASEESTGISSLSAFRPTHREVNKVKVTTLAKVMEAERFEKVDFLKIDTEGHDLHVLKGFPWKQIQPEVILCEFEDNKTRSLGYDCHDLGRFLQSHGYEVWLSEWFPIVRYGGRHKWRGCRKYPVDLVNSDGWGNFLAFRDGTPEGFESLLRSG